VSALPVLLLDHDGTLVDSRVVVARHWALFADRHGLELAPILAVCHGRRTADTIAEVAPRLDARQEAAILDAGEETDVEGLVPVVGARDLLAGLDPGRWAVVTSAHRALAALRLAAVGLPVPAVMVGGDEIDRGKPDPEGFVRAAALLAVDPVDCVVVEDAPAGVAAGRAAGALVVALTTTHAPEELADADLVLADLQGLEHALAAVANRAWHRRVASSASRDGVRDNPR
jgi:sugar-phosphatase